MGAIEISRRCDGMSACCVCRSVKPCVFRFMNLLSLCVVHSSASGHCCAAKGSGLLRVLLHPCSAPGRSPIWPRHPPQLSWCRGKNKGYDLFIDHYWRLVREFCLVFKNAAWRCCVKMLRQGVLHPTQPGLIEFSIGSLLLANVNFWFCSGWGVPECRLQPDCHNHWTRRGTGWRNVSLPFTD